MTRVGMVLLSIGAALFVALLAWQGVGAVAAILATAGWGLALVALFHLLPLVIDAVAIHVLFERERPGLRTAVLARWAGESVNSLLPAGQIGGPVLMIRHLAQRGLAIPDATAAIMVSTTMQTFAQIVFAVAGIGLFGAYAAQGGLVELREPMLIAIGVLSAFFVAFFWAQKSGVFGRALRLAASLGKRRWSEMTPQADAIDVAVNRLYSRHARVFASFVASLAGWAVGTGEVWLALQFLGHPVGWLDALLLESAGQAIRGAAFAIPGSLGFQEGGYLLLAPLVGLPPEAALALSLAKRARELALGLPGIVYLHWSERSRQRARPDALPAVD